MTSSGLSFTLREFQNETDEIMLLYTPLELDNEPDEEFKGRLDFLGGMFTFHRDQIEVFQRNLHERLADPEDEED